MAIRSTILLVEDDGEISGEMQQALDRLGHQVLHATNAEEAIDLAEKYRPLLILTDKDLPTLDSMMDLLRRNHGGRLKDMVVAIIDINDPQLSDSSVKVMPDFAALDDLISATHEATQNPGDVRHRTDHPS